MKTLLLKWWLFVCSCGVGITIVNYLGFFEILLKKDPTRLSFLILLIFLLTTVWIGQKIYNIIKEQNKPKEDLQQDFDIGWFIAESCLVLGLIGTVAGFIIMLGTAFINIDVTSINSMQKALSQMSIGMSAALYTTLMGLLSSLGIKLQLVNVGRTIDRL